MSDLSPPSSCFARLIAAVQAPGPAVTGARGPVSFIELGERAMAYAGALIERGVVPGDRIAALCAPSVELVVANLGHYLAGAIHVPINTRYRGREVEHIVRDSGARRIVVSDNDANRAELRQLDRISIDCLPSAENVVLPPPAGDADPAMLIYTSGTTGASKGVALSYCAIVSNMDALTQHWGWTESDVLSSMLPLFHVHGLCIGIHGALLRRTSVLLHASFDPAVLVKDFAERGATVFMGVPTMYRRLLEYLEEAPERARDLRDARLFTSGSAPLRAADHARFKQLTGHAILERYGMSETLITLSNPLDGERRPGSVGMPVPGCEAIVARQDGQPCDVGERGEIRVRGANLMNGYWNAAEATEREYDGDWFVTGDLGVRDADGYVRILGRKSVDIIKSGGFKISAREIEEVLDGHLAVAELAVFGLEDPTWGQAIAVAVVPAAGFNGDADALLSSLAARVSAELADYKKPRRILVVDELPRNALGKLQKHRLIALAAKLLV